MSTDQLLELSKIISTILIAFFSAYYGSKLALKKYKHEITWSERREAYKEVIDSLEELIHWSEQIRATYYCEPAVNVEANFDDSIRKISKHSATGFLIFSEEFQSVLKKTDTEIYKARFDVNEESAPDMYTEKGRAEWRLVLANEIRTVVGKYLPTLIDIAKSEIP